MRIIPFSAYFPLLSICVACGVCDALYAPYRNVTTDSGQVIGRLEETIRLKKPFYAFRGIPYAKPPVGSLRFKPPEPVDPWTEVIHANDYRPACLQTPNFLSGVYGSSEDCLFINIFVPAKQAINGYPVLLHSPGGAFQRDSGGDALNGPDFLVEQDIIVVTLSYRLGVFGFLSLATPDYSGNMGLKDQQLALKWLSNNIRHFGGDNKRLTLGGFSAGAMLSNYQVLNAESRKYFQQLLLMSGTAIDYNAISSIDHVDEMYAFAQNISQPVDNIAQLIKVLQNAPAQLLLAYTSNMVMKKLEMRAWAPITERANAHSPIVVETAIDAYERAECLGIPALITFTKEEYYSNISPGELQPANLNEFIEHFNISLPIVGFTSPYSSQQYQHLLERIRAFYFGAANSDYQRSLQYIQLYSDLGRIYYVDKVAKLHAKKSCRNTFYHRFSVDSILNVFKNRMNFSLPGTAHGDDQCYAFRCRVAGDTYEQIFSDPSSEISQICNKTIDDLTTMIGNFVKYGRPAIAGMPLEGYKPISNDEINFLDITNDGLMLGQSPNLRSSTLLDDVFVKAMQIQQSV